MSGVMDGSLAGRCNPPIQKGDEVVAVNGKNLNEQFQPLDQVQHTLKACIIEDERLTLSLRRKQIFFDVEILAGNQASVRSADAGGASSEPFPHPLGSHGHGKLINQFASFVQRTNAEVDDTPVIDPMDALSVSSEFQQRRQGSPTAELPQYEFAGRTNSSVSEQDSIGYVHAFCAHA